MRKKETFWRGNTSVKEKLTGKEKQSVGRRGGKKEEPCWALIDTRCPSEALLGEKRRGGTHRGGKLEQGSIAASTQGWKESKGPGSHQHLGKEVREKGLKEKKKPPSKSNQGDDSKLRKRMPSTAETHLFRLSDVGGAGRQRGKKKKKPQLKQKGGKGE